STPKSAVSSACFIPRAGDGIRARNVTGVQTCALPIFAPAPRSPGRTTRLAPRSEAGTAPPRDAARCTPFIVSSPSPDEEPRMSVTDLSPHRPSPPPAAPAAPARSHRDPGIDLVRALCVAAVMLVHGLQVAVTLGADGPVLEYATRGAAWYPALTWVLQVMPLFFVVSGFAGAIGLRRLHARGGSAADFLAARVHRLLVPALAPLAVFAAALTALAALGVPEELLREAGLRWREPLWFLAVFLGVQALLPRLLRLHDRAPWTSLFALVGAAVL